MYRLVSNIPFPFGVWYVLLQVEAYRKVICKSGYYRLYSLFLSLQVFCDIYTIQP